MLVDQTDKDRAQKVLDRNDKLKSTKAPWLPVWQMIGEFVMTRKQDFTTTITPGQFVTGKIFDSTAPTANHFMASSMIGALYPNGGKTFQVEPSRSLSKKDAQSAEVKAWYEDVSDTMADAMDNPRAGFYTSLEEYMLDQGSIGTSGILVEENEDKQDTHTPVRFTAVDVKQCCIDEGADGFVDTVYIEKQLTIKQMVQVYGLDALPEDARNQYNSGELDEKRTVLHAIEPRMDTLGGFGNRAMPVASIHIDVRAQHILKESGFQEMPIFITRFWKAMGEIYGRSPAFEAMPDIIEINSMRESTIVATEKMLDPPLLLKSDGSAGGGTLDTSANALNVRIVSGRMQDHGPFVEQLVTVGNIEPTYKRIDKLEEVISNAFFMDRLSDLNNETRMTLGEANIRNELRGQSLNTIYSRQIAELFQRVIERVFNILLGRGMFGMPVESPQTQQALARGEEPKIMPAAVFKLLTSGGDAYRIKFMTPAARIMRAEELRGVQQIAQWLVEMGPVVPDLIDNFNTDELAKDMTDLSGAPIRILRSAEEIANIRQGRSNAQAQQADLAAKHVGAETARAAGQGALAAAKAGLPLDSLFPQPQGQTA